MKEPQMKISDISRLLVNARKNVRNVINNGIVDPITAARDCDVVDYCFMEARKQLELRRRARVQKDF